MSILNETKPESSDKTKGLSDIDSKELKSALLNGDREVATLVYELLKRSADKTENNN